MISRKKTAVKFFLVILGLFVIFSLKFAFAQTASELKDKISDRNTEIAKLEQQIKEYQKQLDDLGGQANSLKVQLQKLDLTKKKLLADIKVTENKISATNLEIERLSLDIGGKEEKISQDQQIIARSLRQIQEMDISSILQNLLSQDKLSEIWNEAESLKSIQAKLGERIQELKSVKADLEDNKSEAEQAKQELVNLKGELNDQKKINDQNTADKNRLLKETKNKESEYNKILKAAIVRKDAFEKELRDYESQLKFILDPKTLPGSGVLAWPLSNVYITQLFGATVDAKRLYTSGSHNGVDFAASLGTPVKAAASGVVMGTGDTDATCPKASYGKWVLVKHGNGLATLYAHLSLIKVSRGDNVATGGLLGYSGSTGYSTGPHLHLSVYAASAVEVKSLPSKSCGGKIYTMPVAPINAYLDPMTYLPPYKKK